MAKFVAYYRVSTVGQARSGLGLDAQKAAVEGYVDQVNGDLVTSFQETESGANNDRAKLRQALQFCRVAKAMLVVARLDRLARNVSFIAQLLESGVDFIAADMPEANRLTIHVIAAIAEYERQVISDRTKSALQRAKASGTKLGNPSIKKEQPGAVAAAQRKADLFARRMAKVIKLHDPDGAFSATKLANVLTAEGVRTARGKWWTAAAVIALRKRIQKVAIEDEINATGG